MSQRNYRDKKVPFHCLYFLHWVMVVEVESVGFVEFEVFVVIVESVESVGYSRVSGSFWPVSMS